MKHGGAADFQWKWNSKIHIHTKTSDVYLNISQNNHNMIIFCWTRFSSSLRTNTPHYIIITSLNVAHMAAEWNNKNIYADDILKTNVKR